MFNSNDVSISDKVKEIWLSELSKQGETAFSVSGLIHSTQLFVRTLLTIALAIPRTYFGFLFTIAHTIYSMFTYHIFWWTTPNQPFHNELFMVRSAVKFCAKRGPNLFLLFNSFWDPTPRSAALSQARSSRKAEQ